MPVRVPQFLPADDAKPKRIGSVSIIQCAVGDDSEKSLAGSRHWNCLEVLLPESKTETAFAMAASCDSLSHRELLVS